MGGGGRLQIGVREISNRGRNYKSRQRLQIGAEHWHVNATDFAIVAALPK